MADPLSCVLKASNRTNGFDIVLTDDSKLRARHTLPIVAKDWTVTLKDGATFTFGGDFVRRIAGSEVTEVRKDITFMADGSWDVNVQGDSRSEVGGSFVRTIAGSESADIKGDFRSEVGGNVVTHTTGKRTETVDDIFVINTPVLELSGSLLVSGTVQSQSTLGGVTAWLEDPVATLPDGILPIPLVAGSVVGPKVDLTFQPEISGVEVGRSGFFTLNAGASFYETGNAVLYVLVNGVSTAASNIVRGTGLASVSVTLELQTNDVVTLAYQTDLGGPEGLGGPPIFQSRTAWLNVTRIL